MQNGSIESFNGRMRNELLNESLFFNFAMSEACLLRTRSRRLCADIAAVRARRPKRCKLAGNPRLRSGSGAKAQANRTWLKRANDPTDPLNREEREPKDRPRT